MTDELREFLEGLENGQADELWQWLDNYGMDALQEMIAVLSSSHPSLGSED